MTGKPQNSIHTSKTRQQAVEGLVQLFSGEEAGEQHLQDWSSKPTTYQKEFLETAHLLADMESLQHSESIQAILAEPDAVKSKPASKPKFVRWAVAASVLLVLAITHFMFNTKTAPLPNNDVQRYVTRIGEQKQIDLADGSVIYLNTSSEVLVEMRDTARLVTLRRGEAFFDVAKDPQRIFSVDIGPRSVSVLGTEFNIRKMPEKFSLEVVEGEVALHKNSGIEMNSSQVAELTALMEVPESSGDISANGQYRIGAGWGAEFEVSEKTNTLKSYKVAHRDNSYGWRFGQIDFANESLHKVVQELNRYSGKRIVIVDASVMDMSITGSFRIDRVYSALEALEVAYPVQMTHDFDQIAISAKANKK